MNESVLLTEVDYNNLSTGRADPTNVDQYNNTNVRRDKHSSDKITLTLFIKLCLTPFNLRK